MQKDLKEFIKSFLINNSIFLLGFFVLSLLFFNSYDYSKLFIGGDMDFPEISPWVNLTNSDSLWYSYQGFGVDGSLGFGKIVHYILIYVLSLYINNIPTLRMFVVLLLFILPYLSIYILLRYLTKENKFSAIGGIFYVLNIYTTITNYNVNLIHKYSLWLLPLLTLFLIKYFLEEKNKYVLFLGVILFLSGIIFINFSFTATIYIYLLLVAFFMLIINLNYANLTRFVLFVATIFLASSHWLIPSIRSYFFVNNSTLNSFQDFYSYETFDFVNRNITLDNVLKLLGPGIWDYVDVLTFGGYYYKFNSFFNANYINPMLYIPVFIISFLLLDRYLFKNYMLRISLLIFFIFIFLLKTVNPPFGDLFKWTFLNIPGFQMYRDPYIKFGMILILVTTVLITYAIKRFKFLLMPFFLYILLFVYIGFTYGLFRNDDFVNVPKEYFELSEYVNKDKEEFRFIALPQSDSDKIFKKYDFGYFGPGLFNSLIRGGVIDNSFNWYRETNINVLDEILESDNITETLKKFNIKYIVIDSNIENYEGYIEINDADFKSKEFGSLKLYINSASSLRELNVPSKKLIMDTHFLQIIDKPTIVKLNKANDSGWALIDLNNKSVLTKQESSETINVWETKPGNYLLVFIPNIIFIVCLIFSSLYLIALYLILKHNMLDAINIWTARRFNNFIHSSEIC